MRVKLLHTTEELLFIYSKRKKVEALEALIQTHTHTYSKRDKVLEDHVALLKREIEEEQRKYDVYIRERVAYKGVFSHKLREATITGVVRMHSNGPVFRIEYGPKDTGFDEVELKALQPI